MDKTLKESLEKDIQNEPMSLKRKKSLDNPTTDYDENELGAMGDVYDVIGTAVKVNSPISTMNPDFTMSDPKPEVLQNPFIIYIRDQLNIIEIINIYLEDKHEITIKNTKTGLETKRIIDYDEEWRLKINRIMLNEIYSTINMSRAEGAKVILAILRYIEGQRGIENTNTEPITPTETNEEKTGFLQKINPFKKK